MEPTKTQQAAADAILEKGVRVKIPAPLFLKLFRVKSLPVTIRASRFGTHIAISRKMLTIEAGWDKLAAGDPDEARRLLVNHGHEASKVIALAILDRWWLIPLLTRPLAWYLRTHMQTGDMGNLLMIMHLINSPANFTNTIRLTRMTAEMTMTPRNLSPDEEKGS